MTIEPPDVLSRILARKRVEIVENGARLPLAELAGRAARAAPARGFLSALRARLERGLPAVIAELKRASPSRGVIRADFDATRLARGYERGGAACLSVLTDETFFKGHGEHLQAARAAVGIPVLRKDFIIDPYQVHEARALGADCVLLIVAALDDAALLSLSRLAAELGMDVLVEVHDRRELKRALALPAPMIGVNNRDLKSFRTTLDTTLELVEHVPDDRLIVTESGIHTRSDVRRMRENGVHCFLVGEALMRARDPGRKLEELFFHAALNIR